MPQLKGKQIVDGTITDQKVDTSVIVADGTHAFTADQPMGSNKLTGLADGTNANDAVNKGQLDAALLGLSWKEPAAVLQYLGTRTITQINALTPATGDAVVAGDAGTPTAGTSDALAAGDVAEYDGTSWKLIVTNVGGFVPDGTRLVVAHPSTGQTLFAPLTDNVDEGKIAEFDGASNTPATLLTSVDGDAILINAEGSVNENKSWVYDGVVPSGTWVQFSGSGNPVIGGDGLVKTGDTLDVVGGDGIIANADDITLDLLAAGGLKIVGGGGTGELAVEPADFAGTGLEDDGADNLRLAAQGNGIAGGAGSLLSVQADGDTITVGAGGVKSISRQTVDKDLSPAVTAGDGADTLLNIAATPVGGRYVQVFVNGLKVSIGDGVKTKDCYFSPDAGTTARAFSAIVAGDDFIWNGLVADYELEASDSIDFDYDIVAP